MGKFKAGDLVKTREAHSDLALSKNELGRVVDVAPGKDETGSYGVAVHFATDTEYFDYEVHMANHELKKVGTKVKRKKAAMLVVGDQVVLEGDIADEVIHAEVYKIKEIEHDFVKDIVTLRGKGFTVQLTPLELTYKVPVVV